MRKAIIVKHLTEHGLNMIGSIPSGLNKLLAITQPHQHFCLIHESLLEKKQTDVGSEHIWMHYLYKGNDVHIFELSTVFGSC